MLSEKRKAYRKEYRKAKRARARAERERLKAAPAKPARPEAKATPQSILRDYVKRFGPFEVRNQSGPRYQFEQILHIAQRGKMALSLATGIDQLLDEREAQAKEDATRVLRNAEQEAFEREQEAAA